jgi:hypothetical protein
MAKTITFVSVYILQASAFTNDAGSKVWIIDYGLVDDAGIKYPGKRVTVTEESMDATDLDRVTRFLNRSEHKATELEGL